MMEAFFDTLSIVTPLIILYHWWRDRRDYLRLRTNHHRVCTAASCILRAHGHTAADGKRVLFAPADLLDDMPDRINLEVIVATDENKVPEHIGLAVSIPDDSQRKPRREPRPLELEPDVQAALA